MSLVGHAYDKQSPATLVVADWVVDPETVVTTCAARDRSSALHLVVPDWLHGLDWRATRLPASRVPAASSSASSTFAGWPTFASPQQR